MKPHKPYKEATWGNLVPVWNTMAYLEMHFS